MQKLTLMLVVVLLPVLVRAQDGTSATTQSGQNGIRFRSPDQLAADTDQLKRMVIALQRQVDELKAELSAIKAKTGGAESVPDAPATAPMGDGRLKIGMSEDQCDAVEEKAWKKVLVDVTAARRVVEYRSPVRFSSGFQEKDTCWFNADGKLVRFQPVRLHDQ